MPGSNLLREICREALRAEPSAVQLLGGTLNEVARVEVQGHRYFVKWNDSAPVHFFEAEAHGLERLRETHTLRVPEVIANAEATANWPAYLILEWIDGSPRGGSEDFTRRFGQGLADLHRCSASTFGLDTDNFIGALPQSNTQTHHWADFYRDQRIFPQMELARQNGHLPAAREGLLNRLIERLDELIGSDDITPSLLHGDLWNGNFLVASDGQPVVVDPAVYYGEREVEIAFTELFGGFPPGFLEGYGEAYSLGIAYSERRALYQLYPMLVHLNLFGEAYGRQVDAICKRYIGG